MSIHPYTLWAYGDESGNPGDLQDPFTERPLVVVEARDHPRFHPRLQATIAEATGIDPSHILIRRKDDRDHGAGLQVADALAWAFYQNLARGDPVYVALVGDRVTVELVGIDTQGVIRALPEMGG